MSKLTTKQIKKVAQLSKLNIADSELTRYGKELVKIFDFIEQINTVATESLLAVTTNNEYEKLVRQDQVTERNQKELYLKLAPEVKDNLYLVPKVVIGS